MPWTHLANSLTGAGDNNRFASGGFLQFGVLEGVDKVVNIVVVEFLDDGGHFSGFGGYGFLKQLDALIYWDDAILCVRCLWR